MNVNIEAAIAILMISFFVLVIIRLPVTFALIISTALTMLYCKIPLMTMVQQMSKAVNSFSLLAIPFSSLWVRLWEQGEYRPGFWSLPTSVWATCGAVWPM